MPNRRRVDPRSAADRLESSGPPRGASPAGETSGGATSEGTGKPARGGLRWKIVASFAIAFHLLAVVLPPLAFQTSGAGGPSPLVGMLIRPFQGYGQFLHLDRGYAFFAPDPGPSHLIEAAVVQADGSVRENLYPDLQRQWPRLLYHRHFMLAEFLHEVYWPPGPPEDMVESDPEAAEIWRRRRARYEYLRKSIIDHLSHVHDGRQAAIRRIEHGQPNLQDFVSEPIPLDDPRLYRVLLDQPVDAELMEPSGDAEPIPRPLKSQGDSQNAGPERVQQQDPSPSGTRSREDETDRVKASPGSSSPSAQGGAAR